MIEHALFPTLIAEDLNPNNDAFKEIFFEHALDHFTNGFSYEGTGNLDLQTDPNFYPIYAYATLKAKEYLSRLVADPEVFDLNVVKSWLNVSTIEDNPQHSHGDAHLSFAYYLNIPKDVNKDIRFVVNRNHPNNLYAGMLEINTADYNIFNSMSWGLTPKEGTLFLFPSHLEHFVASRFDTALVLEGEPPVTGVEDLKTRRVCLAGDIVLTFKEKNPVPLGLQPIKNWRTF